MKRKNAFYKQKLDVKRPLVIDNKGFKLFYIYKLTKNWHLGKYSFKSIVYTTF